MPFGDYTAEECEAEIAAIDAQLAEMRGLADFRVGNKAFSGMSRARADLRAERAEWVRRYNALTSGTHPLQGPKLTPV